MQTHIIDPIKCQTWDDLVSSNKDCTIFHSSGWAQVLHESYDYKPIYFGSVENGRLTSLLPVMEINSILTGRRGVSLPFTDYCEPLLPQKMHFYEVFSRLIEHGRYAGWDSIELRGCKNHFKDDPSSSSYIGHALELSENEQGIFSSFRDSTQRNIRKASASGVRIRICSSLNAVKEYYRLHCLTRKRQGLPPQPFYFLRKVHDYIISKNQGIVILAYHNNCAISGAICFHFGNQAIYKYGASDRTYQHLRANNLVIWEAIRKYCHNGYRTFSFGRTDPWNYGLRQFKNGWGTSEYMINYYKYDLRKNNFIFKKEPQPNRIDYSKITKIIPIFLLKMAGYLFYRHFG